MASDERARLIRRTAGLRRLLEGITDVMARAAINEEIAKQEARIAEIDNQAPEELPSNQHDEIRRKAPRE